MPGPSALAITEFHCIMTTAGQAIWILPGVHCGTDLTVRQSTVLLCPSVSVDL